jgi:hypothetical protein
MAPLSEHFFIWAILEFAFHPDAKKPGKPVQWYKDRSIVEGIVDAVARQPLFAELKLAGPDGEVTKFKNVGEAKKLVATGTDDGVALQDVDGARKAVVRIAPSDGSMEIRIRIGGAPLGRQHKTILDQIAAIATDVRAQLDGSAGLQFGYAFPIDQRSNVFEYPRPRPPREHATITVSSVLDLIDLTFHRSKHRDAAGEGAERLAKSELPAFAKRTEKDGLVVIRWASDAADLKDLARGAAAHEEWIGQHLPTSVLPGFNELGDGLEPRGDVQPRPPLTLYAKDTKTGYKAVLVLPDGRVEDTAWNDAKKILKAGKLADGAAVKRVKIVVPLREHTFAIRDRARKEGFAGVVYPDDDGEFWDTDPPGSWAGPPREEAAPAPARSAKPKKTSR